MIAGVVLGPSLLGAAGAGGAGISCFRRSRSRCCTSSRSSASALYMFLVGLDFRSDDFSANAPSAVAVSISGIVVPFLVAIVGTPCLMSVPGLFAAGRLALQRHAVPRRRHRHHRVSGARAHHPRARPRRHTDRHAVAVGRGDRRRRRLVRARRGARQPRRRRRRRRARHRRRHRARRRADLPGPAIVRAARAPGRARARGGPAAEHHGARGGADVVHACPPWSPTSSGCTRCSAAS